jgi:hypothetical protein
MYVCITLGAVGLFCELVNVGNTGKTLIYYRPGESYNACKRLTNETTTQRMRGELHINPLNMLRNMVEYLKSHGHAPKTW